MAEGQEIERVEYSPDFDFADGVYYTLADFKDNCPALPGAMLCRDDGRPLSQVGMADPVYLRHADTLHLLPSDNVWGYVDRGQVFVRHQDYYNRLSIIGRLCFVTHNDRNIDYDYMYTSYVDEELTERRRPNVQFIFDLVTGEKEELTPESLLRMLRPDAQLHAEYATIERKSERRKKMYLFIRRFNERQPISFPKAPCVEYSARKR